MKYITHGEVNLIEIEAIPSEAKAYTPDKTEMCLGKLKIADSETTGNHHLLKIGDGVELYEENGTLYIKNTKVSEVSCVDTRRHDTVKLPVGNWMIKKSKEFDHLERMEREVYD